MTHLHHIVSFLDTKSVLMFRQVNTEWKEAVDSIYLNKPSIVEATIRMTRSIIKNGIQVPVKKPPAICSVKICPTIYVMFEKDDIFLILLKNNQCFQCLVGKMAFVNIVLIPKEVEIQWKSEIPFILLSKKLDSFNHEFHLLIEFKLDFRIKIKSKLICLPFSLNFVYQILKISDLNEMISQFQPFQPRHIFLICNTPMNTLVFSSFGNTFLICCRDSTDGTVKATFFQLDNTLQFPFKEQRLFIHSQESPIHFKTTTSSISGNVIVWVKHQKAYVLNFLSSFDFKPDSVIFHPSENNQLCYCSLQPTDNSRFYACGLDSDGNLCNIFVNNLPLIHEKGRKFYFFDDNTFYSEYANYIYDFKLSKTCLGKLKNVFKIVSSSDHQQRINNIRI